MKILENLSTKKTSRKNFIFYTGLVLMGSYALIKFPFKFFGGKEKEQAEDKKSDRVMFRVNPDSVKRV